MQIDLPEKLYYKIGELAKAFDLEASTLRYWETQFPIIKPKKNDKNTRYYTKEDVKNLKKIHYLLREKSYTIEGAKSYMSTDEKLDEKLDIIARLEFVKAELIKLKESITNS